MTCSVGAFSIRGSFVKGESNAHSLPVFTDMLSISRDSSCVNGGALFDQCTGCDRCVASAAGICTAGSPDIHSRAIVGRPVCLLGAGRALGPHGLGGGRPHRQRIPRFPVERIVLKDSGRFRCGMHLFLFPPASRCVTAVLLLHHLDI